MGAGTLIALKAAPTLFSKFAAAAPALTAISTGFSVLSTIQQGNAQQQQSNFQAQQLAQQQERERQIGEQEVDDFRRRAASRQATATAQLGAMGVTDVSGSVPLSEQDFLAEVEVQAARIGNASDARQQKLQSEEELERFSSRTTGKRTALSAIGAGLSGLGKVDFGKA